MPDTNLRHWVMLRHVPRHPRKVDAASLARLLAESGFEVSRRSIERDLIKLSSVFPLVCDDQHKPYGWSWMAGAGSFDLPAMDVHTALAFRMAAQHLFGALPEVTRDYLEPHFARAQAVLDGLAGNQLSQWPEKVRVLPSGQQLLPSVVARDVLEQVQAGLLADRALEVVYRKRGESEPRTYIAHPQALVWRDAVGYLLCTLREYDQPLVQLLLHRMDAVTVLDQVRRPMPGFSVDAAIAAGTIDFLLAGERMVLELLFDASAAVRVRETPLSADQTLTDEADGRVRLRASLPDTVQLRAWLRSFGEFVEVVAPAELRTAMANTARGLAKCYGAEKVGA
jgi:predicted DNA-binding transcriptional regulator YafY